MRKKIVAGNWKMHKNLEEGVQLASEVINMAKDELNTNINLVLASPFIHLVSLQKLIPNGQTMISLAAQNCHHEIQGAFTGEVSAAMLASIPVGYCIVGHSERREYMHETDAQIATKMALLLAQNITPIFCCGEPLSIRQNNEHLTYISQQLQNALFQFSANDVSKIVIAYEPIWAIGTGLTANAAQAQEMHAHIRSNLAKQYNDEIAQSISILYGGSCKPENAAELFACADVDGGLIGGASLKSRDFINIAKSF
ncbi:MAG: triose-phosphate isomerase [Cytophagales bacterium]|nr:MAG: triose-phosphate isomerase [Cytophagales bacterium]